MQVYKLSENIKSKGGKITRDPGPVKGGSTVIAFAQDPDGYMFELIQRAETPEPLCQVMLFALVTLSVLSSFMRRYFLPFCKAGLFQKLEMCFFFLSPDEQSFSFSCMVHSLFVSMQALGMKLLRKKDVPDYKVLAVIWH
jgi:hypothetical protein